MKMSSKFTVSVQMLMLISVSESKKVTSEMISESTGSNPVMVRQLFGKLKKAGILNVTTGRGATMLLKSPSVISLWDIYMAVEEYSSKELIKFHPQISNGCEVGRFFEDILSVHLDEAVQAMGEKMSKITLTQLIDEWRLANPDKVNKCIHRDMPEA
jgi:DNA-binding IscR family transcriptional regulator